VLIKDEFRYVEPGSSKVNRKIVLIRVSVKAFIFGEGKLQLMNMLKVIPKAIQ